MHPSTADAQEIPAREEFDCGKTRGATLEFYRNKTRAYLFRIQRSDVSLRLESEGYKLRESI